ncbi:MAG: redoxin domain-containing protein [Fibromonadales bacterium]|nr:redoxin domain-containing protein [Fibromonadales bacterium]
MKKNILALLLLSFTLSFAAADELERSQKLPLPAQLQKDAFPWFVARDKGDKDPFSKKHLEGLVGPQTKRVALVLFATWCVPCKEGVVRLRESQAELEKNGVLVILVNAGEKKFDYPAIQSWIKENGSDKWPVVLDKFGNILKNTGLSTGSEDIIFPKTILMDNKLKPLLLIGAEGKDWPRILWE